MEIRKTFKILIQLTDKTKQKEKEFDRLPHNFCGILTADLNWRVENFK
jgi:hypothetical protein